MTYPLNVSGVMCLSICTDAVHAGISIAVLLPFGVTFDLINPYLNSIYKPLLNKLSTQHQHKKISS